VITVSSYEGEQEQREQGWQFDTRAVIFQIIDLAYHSVDLVCHRYPTNGPEVPHILFKFAMALLLQRIKDALILVSTFLLRTAGMQLTLQ
jgi:hypothetical protein